MLDDAISIFDNSNDLERDYITSLKLTKAKIYDYMGLHDRAFNEIKNEIDVNTAVKRLHELKGEKHDEK